MLNKMAVLLGFLLLVVILVRGETSTRPDCSPETSSAERSLSFVINRQKAEQSQRLHLEALFNRYGENGSISLAGLKRLLQSLGLDRIRTVTVRHHEKPGHHQHYNHSHHHGNHENHHHNDYSHNGDSHQQRHRPNDKNQHEQQNNDLDHDHDDHLHNDSNEAQDPRTKVESSSNGKSLDDGGNITEKGEREYYEFDKKKAHESSTTSTANVELQRVKREGPTTAHELVTQIQASGGHGDNRERGKRFQEHEHDHEHNYEHQVRSVDHSECLNASSLLSTHGLSPNGRLTLGDFSLLCPALLHQMDGGACVQHMGPDHRHHRHHHGNHSHSEHSAGDGSRNIIIAWVGGFTSISIISLLSLLGVVLIPLMSKVFFNFLLSFLVALAVGTLSGDAFLHLIPHSQVGHLHYHELSSDGPHHDHKDNLDGVWKGLTALGGVYFMFLIEHFLTLGKMYKDKKHKIQKKGEQNDSTDPDKQAALEENLLKNKEEVDAIVAGGVADEEQVMLSPAPQLFVLTAPGYNEVDCENKCHSHFHDTVGQPDEQRHHHHDYHHILHHHHSQNHHPHSHSHDLAHLQGAGIASLAWMVVMGDGLHNFSDGLAIGAAFTEGLSSGLSTSVAVFCHELPHELGDFAVLLKAGMTVRQAILYNVLSALMAYLGMVTGILIGHYAENVSMWIFALTAGLFMYVALVDMMPEMLHNDAGDHGFSHWGFFCLQNAGILLGFGIMLVIAVFEHKIQLDLGY